MKIKLIEEGNNQDYNTYQEEITSWMIYKIMDDDNNTLGHVELTFHADSYNENKKEV